MLRNYLKVAIRYLRNHKGYTLINISGLAVSISCCLLIMVFVRSELSYDRFHSKSDRLYRAWLEEHYQGEVFTNTITPIPLGPALQAGLPEIESTCRISGGKTAIRYNNNSFDDPIYLVDSTFFNLFDFPLIAGNAQNPFASSSSVVITEKAAKKYFGTVNPLGKTLEIEL